MVWRRTTVGPGHARILPADCMDLIWCDGELLVAGPGTRAHVTADRAGARYVGLRLEPGMGPSVFGAPAHELRDLRVPLAARWPSAGVRRLALAAVTAGYADQAPFAREVQDLAGVPLRDLLAP